MKIKGCRILHIANDYPFPPNHGGRVDVWRRLVSLTRLGCKVDLVATLKYATDEECRDHVLRNCRTLRTINRNLGCFIPDTPFQWSSRRSLATMHLPEKYDLLLLESEQCAPILRNPSIGEAKIIIRVHNDESEYLRHLASANKSWWRKRFYNREARLFARLSPVIFAQANHLAFSSQKQYLKWTTDHPGDTVRTNWAPPGADAHPEMLHERAGRTVLFVGGLSAPTNQEGILWYLDNVHPSLLEYPGYEFLIVGRTRGAALPRQIEKALCYPKVSLVKDAADLSAYYKQAAVFVNPMRSGASVKVKTINAVEFAVPVVSTRVGNEGTGFIPDEHLMVADTPEEFSAAIRQIIHNPRHGYELASAGLQFLQTTYDHRRCLSEIIEGL